MALVSSVLMASLRERNQTTKPTIKASNNRLGSTTITGSGTDLGNSQRYGSPAQQHVTLTPSIGVIF